MRHGPRRPAGRAPRRAARRHRPVRADARAARERACAVRGSAGDFNWCRGDIRALPFPDGHFALVMAPYGDPAVPHSGARISPRTLAAVAAALRPGGRLVMDW